MVKLIYAGRNISIANAVKKTNELLSLDVFYDAVSALPQLDNTRFTSSEISKIMKEANHNIKIDTYWWRWGANARTSESNRIEVNTARISSILHVAVNTLTHETVHAIDFLDHRLDFTHFDNNPDGEDNTAPWKIGLIAERMVA